MQNTKNFSENPLSNAVKKASAEIAKHSKRNFLKVKVSLARGVFVLSFLGIIYVIPRIIKIIPLIISQTRSLKYEYIYLDSESGIRNISVDRTDTLKIYKKFSLIFLIP